MRSVAPFLPVLALVLTGCGGDDDPTAKPTAIQSSSSVVAPLPAGEVRGRLVAVGGRAGAQASPLRGTVTFTASDGAIARTEVDSGGEFQIRLSPGSYVLRGTSPDYQDGKVSCSTEENPTLLTEGETTTVDVICLIK